LQAVSEAKKKLHQIAAMAPEVYHALQTSLEEDQDTPFKIAAVKGILAEREVVGVQASKFFISASHAYKRRFSITENGLMAIVPPLRKKGM
jgi:hypothetical protein